MTTYKNLVLVLVGLALINFWIKRAKGEAVISWMVNNRSIFSKNKL